MILLKDGVNYLEYEYQRESELERMVEEHYAEIFGMDTLYFPKQKIKSHSGIGTIPDGFIISMDDKKWFLLEVELSSHDLYKHVVPQVSKFLNAYDASKGKLVKAFYDEVRADPRKSMAFQLKGIGEVHKFVSDIVDSTPTVAIVIDKRTGEIEEICKRLPFDVKIVEFKTFCRENVGIGSHIHVFSPVRPFSTRAVTRDERQRKEKRQIEPRSMGPRVPKEVSDRLSERDWPDHYYRIAKALWKPGTLPYLIRETIRERRATTMRELRGVVKEKGYAPLGGQVLATVLVLERITREVRREGKGESTSIVWV